jgi:RNA polymerase sigma factor (sigma-70 family)
VEEEPEDKGKYHDIESVSDAELVALIVGADSKAEEELDRRFRPRMIKVLVLKTRDTSAAEDIWQQTIFIALKSIRENRINKHEKLSSYIYGIAMNLARNQFKGPQTQPIEGRDFIDEGPGPFEALLLSEQKQLIREVIEEFKPIQYRKILYRCYVYKEDKDKICEEMHLTKTQFNNLLCRAREALIDAVKKRLKRHR